MSYDVRIRKNATGEVRTVHQDLPWNDSSHFWWTDGNMGCECNLGIQFYGDEESEEDFDCNDGSFTAVEAIMPGGIIIPLKGED